LDWKPARPAIYKIFNKIIYKDMEGVGIIEGDIYKKKELYRYWEVGKNNICWGHTYGEDKFLFDLKRIKNGVVHKFNICEYPESNSGSFGEKRTIDLDFGPISTAGNYVIQGYRYTLRDLKSQNKYEIAQYPDGEVILLKKSDPKHFVTLTPKARKHLKMKNAEGEIVPINDATFDKYRIAHP